MNIIFAGKYCKNLNIEKFKKYKYKFIDEFEDYQKYLHEVDYIISYGYGKIFKNVDILGITSQGRQKIH